MEWHLQNILIAHCDLNGSKDIDGFSYNSILESKLSSLVFDYVALGHIHKNNIQGGNKILYPGSTISLGFDELGEHGMIVGELEDGKLKTEFIKIDDREFKEIEVNVNNFYSKEDLAEAILNLDLEEQNIYKVILTGNRNFEINTREILRVVSRENVLKIKDSTKINYDVEQISKQKNLRGIFIKEVLNMYKNGLCTEEEYQKAIEIGLDVM